MNPGIFLRGVMTSFTSKTLCWNLSRKRVEEIKKYPQATSEDRIFSSGAYNCPGWVRVAKTIWYTTRFRQIVSRIIFCRDITEAGLVWKFWRRVVCGCRQRFQIWIFKENSKSPQMKICPILKIWPKFEIWSNRQNHRICPGNQWFSSFWSQIWNFGFGIVVVFQILLHCIPFGIGNESKSLPELNFGLGTSRNLSQNWILAWEWVEIVPSSKFIHHR